MRPNGLQGFDGISAACFTQSHDTDKPYTPNYSLKRTQSLCMQRLALALPYPMCYTNKSLVGLCSALAATNPDTISHKRLTQGLGAYP